LTKNSLSLLHSKFINKVLQYFASSQLLHKKRQQSCT